jgi:ubiquinone/menaquinone biosynthesis C-methylase UbiE
MASHSSEMASAQAQEPHQHPHVVGSIAPPCDTCWDARSPCEDNRPCTRCRELGIDCLSYDPQPTAIIDTDAPPTTEHADHSHFGLAQESHPALETQATTNTTIDTPATNAPPFTTEHLPSSDVDRASTQEHHPVSGIHQTTNPDAPATNVLPLVVENSSISNLDIQDVVSTQEPHSAPETQPTEIQPTTDVDVPVPDAPPFAPERASSSSIDIPELAQESHPKPGIPSSTNTDVDTLITDAPPFTTEHPYSSNADIPDTASTVASSISNPTLEVDSSSSTYDDSDADSGITDVRGLSSTQSARSSIYDFVEEHGRTFHKYKEGKYVLPNDALEQDRLDLQHHLLLILLEGRLQLAPISKNLQDVLDVGTGTGIWAIEFANRYPSASVIGSDLSPIQPEFVPPNCQFEIDDAEDEWMYSTKFDFIHMRGMMTCFTDPRSVLEKAYNQCAPGGYLEMQDGVFPMHCHDDTLAGTALDTWGKACLEAGAKIGRPWNNAPKYRQWMEDIGFEDVTEKIFEVATSTWPRGRKAKELGMWFQADMLDVLGASKVLLTKVMQWAPETVDMLLVEARNDLKNRGIHAYMPM